MSAVPVWRLRVLSVKVSDLDRASRWCYRGALLFAMALGSDVFAKKWPFVFGSLVFVVLALGCELYRLVLLFEYPDVYVARLKGWIRRPSVEALAEVDGRD